VPPFILTVPPLFNNTEFALTICPLVLNVPPETLNEAQKLSLSVTVPLALIEPLVFTNVKIPNAEVPVVMVVLAPPI